VHQLTIQKEHDSKPSAILLLSLNFTSRELHTKIKIFVCHSGNPTKNNNKYTVLIAATDLRLNVKNVRAHSAAKVNSLVYRA